MEIIRLGRSRLISPAGHSWDAFFEGPPISDDFMAKRSTLKTESREPV